jgi:hypothetical protein
MLGGYLFRKQSMQITKEYTKETGRPFWSDLTGWWLKRDEVLGGQGRNQGINITFAKLLKMWIEEAVNWCSGTHV